MQATSAETQEGPLGGHQGEELDPDLDREFTTFMELREERQRRLLDHEYETEAEAEDEEEAAASHPLSLAIDVADATDDAEAARGASTGAPGA